MNKKLLNTLVFISLAFAIHYMVTRKKLSTQKAQEAIKSSPTVSKLLRSPSSTQSTDHTKEHNRKVQKKVTEKLKKGLLPKEEVKMTFLKHTTFIKSYGKIPVEKYKVEVTNAKGLKSSYVALVDPQTSRVLRTYGKRRYEFKQPTRFTLPDTGLTRSQITPWPGARP